MQPLPFSEAELLNLFVSLARSLAYLLLDSIRFLIIGFNKCLCCVYCIAYYIWFMCERSLIDHNNNNNEAIFVFRLFLHVFFCVCVLHSFHLSLFCFGAAVCVLCDFHSYDETTFMSALVDERTRCNDLIRCDANQSEK